MIMNILLPTRKSHLQKTIFLTFLFILLCVPLTSYASPSIYTIQTGSFLRTADAQKEFDSLVHVLNEKERDYLRIERIGKFYSVRLGKFEKMHEAEKFLHSVQQKVTTFLLMKAFYKEERIERLYEAGAGEVPHTQDDPITRPLSVNKKPHVSKGAFVKVDEKKHAQPVEDQVRTLLDPVEKKEYEEALEEIKAELAIRPEDPEIIGSYGTLLYKLEQPAEAIIYLQKAAELSPGVSDYHNRIGYCLILLHKFNEALDAFNKAVAINPEHVGALAGLGITYSELGEKEKAMGVYDKLKNLDRVITEILFQIIEET